MSHSHGWTVSAVAPAHASSRPPHYPTNVIEHEQQWRLRPHGSVTAPLGARVIATRWRALAAREVSTQTPNHCHVIGIALRSMDEYLSVAGRNVRDGVSVPGTLLVTGPGVIAHCAFKGPSDALHLHVPNDLFAEYQCDMPEGQTPSFFPESAPPRDPIIEQLGRALLGAEDSLGSFGQLYVDCIGIAIVARLLGWVTGSVRSDRPKVSGLAQWRLKRAVEYVEAHFAEPVSLANVAAAAGLTRMHFAAQFRAATGLRPHEYLLRRRIEHAQEMLIGSDMSTVNVALSVGFQTQSHFTSVFKTLVGQPPHAWRLAHGSQAFSCGSAAIVRVGKTNGLMPA